MPIETQLPGPTRSSWTTIRDRLRRTQPDDNVKVWLEAVDWFEARLGQTWPGWNAGHPLAGQFLVTFGNRAPEGVRLRQLASVFEDGPALREVVRRLGGREWRDYYTAMTELEVAAPLKAAGRFVELVLPSHGTAPKPDFHARLHDRVVAFECTALIDSEPERLADQVIARLFDCPRINPNLRNAVSVRFRTGARASEAFRRLPELERAIVDASVGGVSADLPGLAVVAPISERNPVPTVAIHGGLVVGTGEKPLTQLGRTVRGKLRHGQLAQPIPGVLFVRTRAFSLYARDDLPAWFQGTADTIHRCFQEAGAGVSAAIVYERWRGAPEQRLDLVERSHIATVGTDEDGSHRFLVLVRNANAEFPLTDDEVDRLVGPHTVW